MKKILILCLFMLMAFSSVSFSATNSFALEIGKTATVIASRCCLYENADFSSNKLTLSSGEEEPSIFYLKHGDKVDITEDQNDFVKIIYTQNKNQTIHGWAYKYYFTQNTSQSVYPVFNATIRTDTIIYDMDYQNSGYSAKKNQRVFIYKSFEQEGYTAVQVVLENQTLYNGYVLKKDVNPDGVSGLLIAGISIIIAGVTIVLSLVFIKKKKKKSKKV